MWKGDEMKAIQVNQYANVYDNLEVVNIKRPTPSYSEVLVKVESASLFPSDDLILNNNYVGKRALPFIGGSIGVGTVVESGGGFFANRLLNKKVYFVPGSSRSGTWAEYALADGKTSLAVGKGNPEHYINFGNSLTAVALVSDAIKQGPKAMVVNAAAGNVGRLINYYAKLKNINVINVVRTEQQHTLLKNMGAATVILESDKRFDIKLIALAKQLNATYAIDSVSGLQLSGLLKNLPNSSCVSVIGNLSGDEAKVNVMQDVIAKGHTIQGFAIADYLAKQSTFKLLSLLRNAKRLHNQYSEQFTLGQSLSLEQASTNMSVLFKNSTASLSIIKPHK